MKKKIYLIMTMVAFLGVGSLYAMQPPSGGGGLPGGPSDAPAGVPIDGGIIALIVLGSTYGVKKYKKLN